VLPDESARSLRRYPLANSSEGQAKESTERRAPGPLENPEHELDQWASADREAFRGKVVQQGLGEVLRRELGVLVEEALRFGIGLLRINTLDEIEDRLHGRIRTPEQEAALL
jgi:hypothetical protein